MSDTRADTTSMGLFLISFIMLVFGIVGIFGFQESDMFAGLYGTTVPMMSIVGILFLFCGYSMYRKDNKFLMIIFGFLGLFALAFSSLVSGDLMAAINKEGAYMFFIVVAIFLIIFALWALLGKAGFMLTILLIAAALVFLFYALVINAMVGLDDPKTYALLMGIFGIIAFVISIYMALADVTDLNLPVM